MKKDKRIKDSENMMGLEMVDVISAEATDSAEMALEQEEEISASEPGAAQVPVIPVISEINKWIYKEFLNSPVLSEVTRIYIANENKESLYDEIRSYMKTHKREEKKIRVELAADRECYNGGGMKLLAMGIGILSVAGIVYALVDACVELGMAFLTMAIFSACMGTVSFKNTACRRMIEYILGVFQVNEKYKK